jgi:hypothetical protein
VWEAIQTWFDGKIKALGVKNAYFPIFITEESLNTEKDHVEGFAAEVRCCTSHAHICRPRPNDGEPNLRSCDLNACWICIETPCNWLDLQRIERIRRGVMVLRASMAARCCSAGTALP